MKRIRSKNINTVAYWDKAYEKCLDPEVIAADMFKFENIAHHVIDGSKVVDLGCGTGELLQVIMRERPNCSIWGIDFSKEAIDQAVKLNFPSFGLGGFKTGDVISTRFENSYFDYVISCEVLEHLEEPKKLIKEAARLLKPGGAFILTTPYKDHIPSPEHLWEFDYVDVENLLYKRFKRLWVFPWAAGWTDVTEVKTKKLIYPKGHWCTIMAIAIK